MLSEAIATSEWLNFGASVKSTLRDRAQIP